MTENKKLIFGLSPCRRGEFFTCADEFTLLEQEHMKYLIDKYSYITEQHNHAFNLMLDENYISKAQL